MDDNIKNFGDIYLEKHREQCITVRETILISYDLYTADECFLTGTGAKLIPVREIDGRKLESCPGETYRRFSSAYFSLVLEETTWIFKKESPMNQSPINAESIPVPKKKTVYPQQFSSLVEGRTK